MFKKVTVMILTVALTSVLAVSAFAKTPVSEAGEESFTVINPKNEGTSTVTYPQVGKIKGHNLSTGAKIAIGVGIAIAIAVAVLFATNEDEIQFP